MENRLISMEGYDLANITVSGFSRGLKPKMIINNMKTLKNLAVASRQTAKILREFKPDIAIGTGGYVCYPVLKKAAKYGIPTVIHESNAVPGLTTKMLSDKVDKVLVGFPNVSALYKRPEKVVFTGTPVRGDFSHLTKEHARTKLGIDNQPLVVSFWGSLGAERMNEIMADFIKLNSETNSFHHIHATGGGKDGVETMMTRLRERNIAEVNTSLVDLRPYIDDMPNVMAAADIVLCRAGASTIAELTMIGKPAILIPSPNVTNNHQEKNAAMVSKAGGAIEILEKNCSGAYLFETVTTLLNDKKRIKTMSESSEKLGVPNAAYKISELIVSLCSSD